MTIPEIIIWLWETGFFKEYKTADQTIKKMEEVGYNLNRPALYAALKRSKILIKKNKRYVQRTPFLKGNSNEKEEKIEKVYDKSNQYSFYSDLKKIIASTKKQIFLVDPYFDSELFEVYLDSSHPIKGIMQFLTSPNNHNLDKTKKLGRKFKAEYNSEYKGKMEIRINEGIHDRLLFIDDRAFAIGQSIQKSTGKRPTYLIEFSTTNTNKLNTIYDKIWNQSKKII